MHRERTGQSCTTSDGEILYGINGKREVVMITQDVNSIGDNDLLRAARQSEKSFKRDRYGNLIIYTLPQDTPNAVSPGDSQAVS